MVEWRFAICIDRWLVVLIELVFGFRLFGVMYVGLLVGFCVGLVCYAGYLIAFVALVF